jgi:MADS-box transcription factor
MDDDDDDDDGSGPSHHGSVEPQMMPPQFQNQAAFQHIRHHTPSASPPIPNGVFQHHPQQRQHTPQPQGGSRPPSRNAPRRQSSNLVPQQPHPQPANGYAYMPNPAIYNPQNGPQMPPHAHGLPPNMQAPQMQGPPQGVPQQGPGPQYPNYGPPQQHPHQQQIQQLYAEEQRRASMPPAFPQQERPASRPEPSPPQPQQQHIPQQQQQNFKQEEEQQPVQQMLEPVKRLSVKSRSIFTPIDESRSILSQHWASSTSNAESSRGEPAPISNSRSQSVDVGSVTRTQITASPPPMPTRSNTHNKNRVSMSSMPDGFTPPSRTNSAQLGGGKRPVLKVQIPDEPSDNGSATADSNSSPHSGTNATGSNHPRNSDSHSSGVVLPPPSPSASALLSAGASGPPNPFARPHPVSQPSQNSNASGNNNLIDTPVSALPSRFMTNEFLPSPSSFYPEWNFRGSDSNTLPSPLNFATPVVGTGPSFLREDSGERERGGSAGNGSNGGVNKRKTPELDNGDGGDMKRMKHDG